MCFNYGCLFVILYGVSVFVIVSGTNIPQEDVVFSTINTLEVKKNSHVVIDCNVTSRAPVLSFTWRHNGQIIKLPQKRVFMATNGSLVIDKITSKSRRDDSGLYECHVTNALGAFIRAMINVVIAKSSVTISPESANVTESGIARFVCTSTIDENSPHVFAWKHPDGTHIPSTDLRITSIAGILQIHNVTRADAGKYTCQVFHPSRGTEFEEISALLNVQPGVPRISPILLTAPQTVRARLDTTAVMECLVEGGRDIKLYWNYTTTGEIKTPSNGRLLKVGNSNLVISHVMESDAGGYTCTVKHADGADIVRHYTLEVLVPPVFVKRPQTSQTQVLSQRQSLVCEARGYPEPEIMWFKNGLRLYHTLHTLGHELQDTIWLYGLTDDAGYYQCIANNSAGIAITVTWIDFRRQPNTPGTVRNLTVVARTSTTVSLMWEAAPYPDLFPIVAYTWSYRTVPETDCPGHCQHLMAYHIETAVTTSTKVEGLFPFTQYAFAVQAFNAKGAGPHSQSVMTRTLEDVPTSIPDVEISHDSATSFRVKWSELPEDQRMGVITRYKLCYGVKEKMMTVKIFPSNTYEYLVTGLEPDHEYSILVLAGTSAGFPEVGENCMPVYEHAWKSYRTAKSIRYESSDIVLKVDAVNSSAVQLSWSQVNVSGMAGYRVVVQPLINVGPVQEFTLLLETRDVLVNGLVDREFYQIDFDVRSSSNEVMDHVVAWHQAIAPGDTPDPPPPIIRDPFSSSDTTIDLFWDIPMTTMSITRYTIRYEHQGSLDPPIEITTKGTSITLRSLQPFTWYVISARSHTNTTSGPFSKPMIVQTMEGVPSPPENVLAENVSPGKIKLQWGPPREQNGIITFYIIYYTGNPVQGMKWSSIQQNATTTSVVLEDLTSQVYYFKLGACTNAGEGQKTQVFSITVKTHPCDTCAECPLSGQCQTSGRKDENNDDFRQKLGILIGCGVGLICIIVCVTFVIYKHRHLSRLYAQRADAKSLTSQVIVPTAVRFSRHAAAHSPMLERMLADIDVESQENASRKTLLEGSSDTNVNTGTLSSTANSIEVSPVSIDCFSMYPDDITDTDDVQCMHEDMHLRSESLA
ncbi:protogenin-like isoform X3 [Dreissena polymorpha]|uniref:Protogenin n=1 Tax=Dreissena polymorpha TaxID=45954 RepID=A0A9D4QLK2_DREPO|nr:protogenin-like isoform X3 [Dreissena polymorpha]KAH3835648.1 hypothetical protein DPMN_109006 [Dreissena polymorpha]